MQIECPRCGESLDYFPGATIVCSWCKNSIGLPTLDALPRDLQQKYEQERRKELARRDRARRRAVVLRELEERAAEAKRKKEAKRILPPGIEGIRIGLLAWAKAFLMGCGMGLLAILSSFVLLVPFGVVAVAARACSYYGIRDEYQTWFKAAPFAMFVVAFGAIYARREWKEFLPKGEDGERLYLSIEEIRERERRRQEEEERRQLEEEQRRLEEAREAKKRWKEFFSRPDMSAIDEMSGVEFEDFLVTLFRKLGYNNVKKTPVSDDQGTDLTCETKEGNGSVLRICVQAKRQAANVGNQVVRETYGAIAIYHCDEGWVVTNSYFTASAEKGARRLNEGKERERVRLRDRDWLIARIEECFPPKVPEFDMADYEEKVKPLLEEERTIVL